MTIIAIAIAAILILFCLIRYFGSQRNLNQIFGVSFNEKYAEYLKLDPREAFTAILDDWGFRYLRLSAQWDEIEAERGVYDFSRLDWYMEEAAKREAKVILAVGQKIPRWPECHPPKWTADLQDNEYFQSLEEFVVETVRRYRSHSALEIWQIENEPFLPFGVCRKFTDKMLKNEIQSVKSLDSTHPTLVTDSGELSSWQKAARRGDLFGTTLYRVVWNKRWGYFNYDWLSPLFYRAKLWLAGRQPSKSYIVELQAEPWVTDHDIHTFSLEEQYKSMSPERFVKNIDYSRRVGFARAYLWGAEWCYWLSQEKGIDDFVDLIKNLKK